jgi:hypothetical protein
VRLELVSWKNLLTHPSEFIRIDEQLRIKQIELATFNNTIGGWTKIAAQENLEHKRLIYSMRSYIYITCYNRFGVSMLSDGEYQSLKDSFVDRENFMTNSDQDYATLNTYSQNEYYLILHLSSDRWNTERLYRKFLGKIIEDMDPTLEWFAKENMINTIVKKCFFTVKLSTPL